MWAEKESMLWIWQQPGVDEQSIQWTARDRVLMNLPPPAAKPRSTTTASVLGELSCPSKPVQNKGSTLAPLPTLLPSGLIFAVWGRNKLTARYIPNSFLGQNQSWYLELFYWRTMPPGKQNWYKLFSPEDSHSRERVELQEWLWFSPHMTEKWQITAPSRLCLQCLYAGKVEDGRTPSIKSQHRFHSSGESCPVTLCVRSGLDSGGPSTG